jgi:hypothetical protein
VSHLETVASEIGNRHYEIVIDIADSGGNVGHAIEVAALALVLAPRVRHGPDRPIPVLLDGHRSVGDPQEVFETTRVLANSFAMMSGEVSVGP